MLAVDFPKRLERLHEVSGLTWAAFARAIGVDPKLVHRWRNGVEPRGWAMHASSASQLGCPEAWRPS